MENKPQQTTPTEQQEQQRDFTPTEDEGNVQGGGSYGSGYGTGSEGSEQSDTSGSESNRS